MKFKIQKFNKTALHIAVEKENIEMIRLLLSNSKINTKLRDDISIS